MRVVGLVAVRMKSTRLKQKALLDLNGLPLILQLLRRVKCARRVDDIVLCTSTHPDDAILLKITEENGFKRFAGSESDIIHRFVKAGEIEQADVIVRVTGDNPFTDPEILDTLIKSHLETDADYTRMDRLPIGITPEVINMSAMKTLLERAEDRSHSEYLTLFFLDHPEVFKINVLDAPETLARPDYRLTVDYPEDYLLIKEVLRFCIRLDTFGTRDIIRFLDSHPEIAGMNARVPLSKIPPSLNTRLRDV